MAKTSGPFIVVSAKEDKTRTNKRYFTLQLKSAQEAGGLTIPAKIWEEVIITLVDRKVQMPTSGQIWETASYDEELYQGQTQYTIRTYKVSDDPGNLKSKFREPCSIDIDTAMSRLFQWTHWPNVYKDFFKNLLLELNEDSLIQKLRDCPAGAKNHHDRRGGLIQHTLEMVDFAGSICRVTEIVSEEGDLIECRGPLNFPEVEINFPLLRAAIIMHDMGKIHDYDVETGGYGADLEGKCLQHSQWGTLAIERNWPRGIEKREKIIFQHAVLAHHGKSIAAVTPQTVEGMLLHQIDALSAYLDVHRTARKLQKEGKFIPYNMMMGETPLI